MALKDYYSGTPVKVKDGSIQVNSKYEIVLVGR